MNNLKTLFFIPLLLFTTFLSAQTVTINDIININKTTRGNILENNEIKGYYLFSQVDKVAPKTFSYLLRIFDANMNEAVSTTLTKSKHAYLVESTFNGEAFMFFFFDRKKKTFELETYDKKGNKLGSKVYEKIKPNDVRLYASLGMMSEETSNPTIFPVGSRGFLRIKMIMISSMKYNYQLEYFPNDMSSSESWTVGTPKGSKMIEFPGIQSISDRFATVIIARRKGAMSKNILYSLQLLDLEEGAVVFEEPMMDKDFNRSALFTEYDPKTKEIMVAGNYFDVKDKTSNAKPKGMYFRTYSPSGEMEKERLLSWEKDMSKFLDVNAKGRMEEGGFVTLHNIVRTNDGKIFAIGERFRKAASAAGIALNVLAAASGSGGAAANTKMVLEEMYVFELDKEYNLKDIKVFEKRKSDVLLPAGYGNLSASMLANVMKAYGWFDYEYTQEDKKKGIFYSTYFSTVKEKGELREPIFGIIAYDGSELTTDQISLKTDAKYLWVDAAKPGYVAIWEYFRKDKKLTLRLEPINY